MSDGNELEKVKFTQPQWYIAEAVNGLAMVTVGYVAVSLIVYGIRTGKWKKENTFKINAGPVYTTAVVAMCSTYIRLIPDQVLFNIGYTNESHVTNWCEILQDASGIGYTTTLSLTYIFLWFRQRSLYQHPVMTGVQRRWLAVISWGTICLVLAGGVTAGVVYVTPQNYGPTPEGCKAVASGINVTGVFLGIGLALVGQGLLVFLFAYPLFSQRHGPNATRIARILKRTFLLTILCVVSDMSVMVVFVVLMPKDATRHAALIMFEMNMLLNLTSVLLSFDSWTRILGSLWRQESAKKGIPPVQTSSVIERNMGVFNTANVSSIK